MTDGTISTIFGLVVGLPAASVSALVVWRERERERGRAAEHEAVSMRDARLRAEFHLLEIQGGELRAQIAQLEERRAHLLEEVEGAAQGSHPAPAAPEGTVKPAKAARARKELARRLEATAGAQVIPFPFLADFLADQES
jgi:hypothetical protein